MCVFSTYIYWIYNKGSGVALEMNHIDQVLLHTHTYILFNWFRKLQIKDFPDLLIKASFGDWFIVKFNTNLVEKMQCEDEASNGHWDHQLEHQNRISMTFHNSCLCVLCVCVCACEKSLWWLKIIIKCTWNFEHCIKLSSPLSRYEMLAAVPVKRRDPFLSNSCRRISRNWEHGMKMQWYGEAFQRRLNEHWVPSPFTDDVIPLHNAH